LKAKLKPGFHRFFRLGVVSFRHCVHYPSLTETHHGDPASHIHHGLAISRVGLLWGERQHRPPTLSVHEDPPRRVHPNGAPDGAHLADHPLLAGKSWASSEGAQRTQYPEEHAPHEHRDHHQGAEQNARVGDARPEERQASGKQRKYAPRGEQAVVGNAHVYDEKRDPNEDQDHPESRGYHHHRSSAVWSLDRFTKGDSIITHK
jgi:hypothetical protein